MRVYQSWMMGHVNFSAYVSWQMKSEDEKVENVSYPRMMGRWNYLYNYFGKIPKLEFLPVFLPFAIVNYIFLGLGLLVGHRKTFLDVCLGFGKF